MHSHYREILLEWSVSVVFATVCGFKAYSGNTVQLSCMPCGEVVCKQYYTSIFLCTPRHAMPWKRKEEADQIVLYFLSWVEISIVRDLNHMRFAVLASH